MRDYIIGDKYLVLQNNGSSNGVQEKYCRNEYWYKVDNSGKEGFTEHLISVLLRCSTLPTNCYVYYEMCKVNGKNGCRSRSFLNEYESFISLSHLYRYIYGGSLEDYLMCIREPKERLNLLLSLGYNINVDLMPYLKVSMYLDMLILNRDRHTKNLGVIYNSKLNSYRRSPIFDNGLSLNTGLPMSEICHSRTISGSFEEQVVTFGYPLESPFKIDYKRVLRELKSYNYKEGIVLLKQLEKYSTIFKK